MSITFTPAGIEVPEEKLFERVKLIREVADFRFEQLNKNSYRILVLPVKNSETRGLKGSVLDALVDVYGMKANLEIDIDELDDELLPEGERAKINSLL